MSETISGIGFPTLALLMAGMARAERNFNTLSEQSSSGLIANTYAGLGDTAPIALSLAPQVETLTIARNNIAAASGPTQVTQTAMEQIGSIAAAMLAAIPNLTSLDAGEVDSIAGQARDDLAQVAGLLDSQYAGVYVFASQDTGNPPVPDPNQIASSRFYARISAAVGGLTSNGAAATIAATLAIASSNAADTSPFSSYMSQPADTLTPPSVSTGDGRSQTIGLLASGNTNAISTGGSTTGSYMRDLLRALATIGSLSSAQANDPNFASLVSDTRTSLSDAITAMNTDVGILGEQQSNLTALSVTLSDTTTVLTGQLSNAQDADMAKTLSSLSLTQTRLQASYQMVAAESGLSLAKYLPTG